MNKPFCCKLECNNMAFWEVRYSDHPEDYSHACNDHVEWMKDQLPMYGEAKYGYPNVTRLEKDILNEATKISLRYTHKIEQENALLREFVENLAQELHKLHPAGATNECGNPVEVEQPEPDPRNRTGKIEDFTPQEQQAQIDELKGIWNALNRGSTLDFLPWLEQENKQREGK